MLTMGFGLVAVVGCVLFLLSNALWAALTSLMLLSGAILANGICTQVVLQTQVPDTVRGKVLSLYTMIFRGLPALGAMAVGLLADKAHERVIFAIGSLPVLVMLLRITWILNKDRKKEAPSRL